MLIYSYFGSLPLSTCSFIFRVKLNYYIFTLLLSYRFKHVHYRANLPFHQQIVYLSAEAFAHKSICFRANIISPHGHTHV